MRTTRTFFEKNFKFQPPKRVFLGIDKHGKQQCSQSVPLVKNVSFFFKGNTSAQFQCVCYSENSESIFDIHDRSVYEHSLLFGSDPHA